MITRNDDGLGIMYRENGRVKVAKSVGTQDERFALFREHRDKPCWAMHSRMRTHGEINEDNCHPYKIMDIDDGDPIDMYMMHNGVLSNAPSIDKKQSDTWHYVEYILKPLIKNNANLFWDNDHINSLIQDHIGKTNKFLFMRSDDVEYPVLILNHGAGVERNGMWLSNTYSIASSDARSYTHTYYVNNNNNYSVNLWHQGKSETWAERCARLELEHAEDSAKRLNDAEQAEFDMLLIEDDNLSLQEKTKGGIILPLSRQTNQVTKKTQVILPHTNELVEIDEDDNEEFMMQLNAVRGMTDSEIIDFVKKESASVADLVMALYDKNTMNFNGIIKQCKKRPDNMVRLLKNMTINYKKKMSA